MSREIRRVPPNWKHPKRLNGSYEPLLNDYVGSLKYWKENVDTFIKAMTTVIQDGKVKIYDTKFTTPKDVYEYLTEDDALTPPDIKNYMPQGDWYQLFEGVSEGTPLSPPFETSEELVEWLSIHKDYWGNQWTRTQAEAMSKAGYSPSGILVNGKIYNSQEALELN